MTGVAFSDSIDGNLDLLRELLGGMGPGHRERAKRAAVKVEQLIVQLQKDNPRDPAIALGTAFAFFMIAQRLVQGSGDAGGAEGGDNPLIQLLS